MVGSSGANLFASISAGICALWGPLHGGANQAVIEMLEQIAADGGNYQKYVDMAKDKTSGFRLMGFGHRVYKNFDPRARILKKAADEVLDELGIDDPLLDIAKRLEEVALTTTTSSSASSTRTSTSTAASSTARWASRPTCSR